MSESTPCSEGPHGPGQAAGAPGSGWPRLARALLATLAMLFAHLVALSVLILFLFRIVPFYEALFTDFDVDLPPVTISVILFSRITANYWYLFVLALGPLDGVPLFFLHLLPPRLGWIKWWWFSAFLLGILLYIAFAGVALSMVSTALVEGLA